MTHPTVRHYWSRDHYRDAFMARFRGREPWYAKWFGIMPRAFWWPDDGHADGVVHVYGPHAKNRKLMAHEWGHAAGYGHPSKYSPRYWLDVMGVGLRLTDKHDLVKRSSQWFEREVRHGD